MTCAARLRIALAGVALLTAAAPITATTTLDDESKPETFKIGTIEIVDPWVTSAIGNNHGAKIFFEFRNRGAAPDQLIEAHTPIADAPAILQLAAPADTETPRMLDAIEFPPGGAAFELNTHGYYLELKETSVPLTMGKRFPLTLKFARAGEITIEVTSRFHSPKLTERIRAAARRGDVEELKRLRDSH